MKNRRSLGTALTAVAVSGAVALGTAASPAQAQTIGPIAGLPSSALAVMNSAPYTEGFWGIAVNDANTGQSLISYNAGQLLEPASVTKTYSSAGAWLEFGPDSRINTPVVRSGKVRSGTLNGNLVLIAKGDITMGGQTGPDGKVIFTNMDHNDANLLPGATIAGNNPLAGLKDLAKQVKRSGIREISGNVVIDNRLFKTEDLAPDGPVTPIVINNNLIDVVSTPTKPGKKAKIKMRPKVAPWTVKNKVTTGPAGTRSRTTISADDNGVITIAGTVAAGSIPDLKVWHMDDPATFARTAFISMLRKAGVKVSASATQANPQKLLPNRKKTDKLPRVANLQGLTLDQQLTYVEKVSYNRGAQTQVCLLAVAAGSRDCEAGMPRLAQLLSAAGINPLGASLVNGSGIPGNFITPNSGEQLMQVFNQRPDAAAWIATLPIMGVDGSLAMVQKNEPSAGHVFAKTGTLGDGDALNGRLRLETKALSGYIQAQSGRLLSFTLIVNQSLFNDIEGVFEANEDLGKIVTDIWGAY